MKQPRQNKALKYFISSVLLLLLLAFYNGEFDQTALETAAVEITNNDSHDFTLSQRAQKHILYGDHSGGGHKYGVGKACKSEFPQTWSDDKIVSVVERIAANDNADWKKQDNGYFVTETNENGVNVRVVLGHDKDEVVTAYPTNLGRNPCPPKPSNDNNYNR